MLSFTPLHASSSPETPRPTAARKGSYTAARNTPFSPLSDLTLPKGASTSLSGPIREVEREVDETQARAQKNKTSPLEVLFDVLFRHLGSPRTGQNLPPATRGLRASRVQPRAEVLFSRPP